MLYYFRDATRIIAPYMISVKNLNYFFCLGFYYLPFQYLSKIITRNEVWVLANFEIEAMKIKAYHSWRHSSMIALDSVAENVSSMK